MQPQQLGPFKIVRTLGRGGMGAVYEAVHVESGEVAAVKALLGVLEEDEEMRLRFEAEIETLKRLRHPNIVRLYGFGEEAGMLYYVMELVDGPSLHQELRRKRHFAWYEVAKIGYELCLALKHAHDRGITHRDIKPANILLDRKGTAKLSDYGIAQFFGGERLTGHNSIVGTLEYMAPEQAQAQPVGPKSDIYSLGAVLYALLAGTPPYAAKSLPELLRRHATMTLEPLRAHRFDVPEPFETIIADLLKTKPEDRPGNTYLVGRRIQSLLQATVGAPEDVAVEVGTENPEETEVPLRSTASPPFSGGLEPFASRGMIVENNLIDLGGVTNLPEDEDGESADAVSNDPPPTATCHNLAAKSKGEFSTQGKSASETDASDFDLLGAEDVDSESVASQDGSPEHTASERVFEQKRPGRFPNPPSTTDFPRPPFDADTSPVTHPDAEEKNPEVSRAVLDGYKSLGIPLPGTVPPISTDFPHLDDLAAFPQIVHFPPEGYDLPASDPASRQPSAAQDDGPGGQGNPGGQESEPTDKESRGRRDAPEVRHGEVFSEKPELPPSKDDPVWEPHHYEFSEEGDSVVVMPTVPDFGEQADSPIPAGTTVSPDFPFGGGQPLTALLGSSDETRLTVLEGGFFQATVSPATVLKNASAPTLPGTQGGRDIPNVAPDGISDRPSGVTDTPVDLGKVGIQISPGSKLPASTSPGHSTSASPDLGLHDTRPIVVSGPENSASRDSTDNSKRPSKYKFALAEAGKMEPLSPERSNISHFVVVGDDDVTDFGETPSKPPRFSIQTLLTVVCLLLIGGLVFYLLRPVPPDVLYQRIKTAVRDNESGDLLTTLRRVDSDIKYFVNHYTDHYGFEEINSYADKLALASQERYYERGVFTKDKIQSMHPAERAYIEALGLIRTAPDLAAEKLRALIALYHPDPVLQLNPADTESGPNGDTASLSDTSEGNPDTETETGDRPLNVKKKRVVGAAEQCVLLARRRLELLEKELTEVNKTQLELMQSRLDDAEQLDVLDPPRAREIRNALIELYSDRSWAAPAVERARKALEETGQNLVEPLQEKDVKE